MRWDTQQTIREVQDAIVSLNRLEERATRQAIARETDRSVSYITKLIKQHPDYLGDIGDGTVSVGIEIDVRYRPRKPIQPDYANTNPSSTDYSALLIRIAEALENSAGKDSSPVGKPNEASSIVATDFHKRLVKAVADWGLYDNTRDKLLNETFHDSLVALYLFYCNVGRYLRKHKLALVQSGETELKRTKQ